MHQTALICSPLVSHLVVLNLGSHIYCRDKGPKSYIGPWPLSEDMEWSEEGQIVIRGSNLKSHE